MDKLALTIGDIKKAVEALGPRPETFEIWVIKNVPRFTKDGEPFIVRFRASTLTFTAVTGADWVIMMNPMTFSDLTVYTMREEGITMYGWYTPLAGIPIFEEEALDAHWRKQTTDKMAGLFDPPIFALDPPMDKFSYFPRHYQMRGTK